MDITDNLLRSVLSVQARNDSDATLQAFAREVQSLRGELTKLRQAFVPVVSTLSAPLREMTMDFNDLCIKHKIAAAVVFPVGKPDGELLLHVAGETRSATLVKAMIDRNAL